MNPSQNCLPFGRVTVADRGGGEGRRKGGSFSLKCESSLNPYFYSRPSINHLIGGARIYVGRVPEVFYNADF